MIKRDFSGETTLSLLRRISYAVFLRLRGFLYSGFFFSRARALTVGPGLLLVNPRGIELGDGVHFGRFSRLEAFFVGKNSCPRIRVGSNCSFGDYFHISSCNAITIGANCLIASKVLIIDNSHGSTMDGARTNPPIQRPLHSKGPIVIGDNVWVGEGVTIYAGSTIPSGAIVPAHSFVSNKFTDFR